MLIFTSENLFQSYVVAIVAALLFFLFSLPPLIRFLQRSLPHEIYRLIGFSLIILIIVFLVDRLFSLRSV